MTKKFSRLILRFLKYLGVILFLVIILIFLFCGPLIEYIIERNDEIWIGRQIEISDLKVNLFNGKIRTIGLEILESEGDLVFAGVREISAQLDIKRLPRRDFLLRSGSISQLTARIAHQGSQFNWDDMIEHLQASEEKTDSTSSKRWNWDLNNLNISGENIRYINERIDHQVIVDSFHFYCPSINNENPEFHVDAFINLEDSGGSLLNDIAFNYQNLHYDWTIDLKALSFHLLLPYLQEYLHTSDLRGFLSTTGKVTGNFLSIEDLNTGADLRIDDFSVLDDQSDTIAAFKRGLLNIDTVDLRNKFFQFDMLSIDRPYIRYELFEEGDNISRLVKISSEDLDSIASDRVSLPGREYFNVFIYLADYASYFVQNYFESNYQADTMSISGGRIQFTDHTLPQRGVFNFSSLNLTASQFDSRSQYVSLHMETYINRDGKMIAEWNVDPHDPLEMELKYTLEDFPMSSFHPYAVYHTGFPFYSGALQYDGFINIHQRTIASENQIRIQGFEVGKKINRDTPVKIPLRLAVSLLKDRKGVIEMDLPVEGDLNDPSYKYWGVIWGALKNNLMKVATAPYNLLAKVFDVDESALREIPFEYLQTDLEKEQERSISQVQKVLKAKPELKLLLHPVNNRELESQKLAAFLVKEKYYRDSIIQPGRALSPEDSVAISTMNDLDSNFVSYVNSQFHPGSLPPTREEKFERIAGTEILNQKIDSIYTLRNDLVIQKLSGDPEVGRERLEFRKPEDDVVVPDTSNLARPFYLLHFDVL